MNHAQHLRPDDGANDDLEHHTWDRKARVQRGDPCRHSDGKGDGDQICGADMFQGGAFLRSGCASKMVGILSASISRGIIKSKSRSLLLLIVRIAVMLAAQWRA
jgi:hypothetical protein